MEPQLKVVRLVVKLGIFLYPAFYLLDIAVYPDQKIPIFVVRIGVALFLVCIHYLLGRFGRKYMFPLIFSAFTVAAMGVSLICVLSGEGLASSYYAGVLELTLLSMALYTLEPRKYAFLVGVMVIQHFAQNLFLPWKYKDLMTNIFALGVISIPVLLLHNIVYSITRENAQLKGLLPICAKCKRIRDEHGTWHQVDDYIHKHSTVEFTHSLCPQCSKQLYGDFL